MKIIKLLKYILLGIIQGYLEPLPVSSSGHIFILKRLLNTSIINDLNLEIILNAGSLLAILLIYRKEIINLIISSYKYIFKKDDTYKKDYLYLIKIIIGIIPIGLTGFLFKDLIELKLNNIKIIGISFIITSILLYIIHNKNGYKNKYDITLKDSLIIGLVTILALIPGISRSGITFVVCILCGLERKATLNYSFMMYIIISIGTTIIGINSINTSLIVPYIIGFIFSFITSLYTLKWFINLVNNNNLKKFSLYCLIIGILVILFMK